MGNLTIIRLQTVDSTSRHARRLADEQRLGLGGGPALIVAREQSGGVGRLGRPWCSPPGGLWCTLVRPLEGQASPALGIRAGMAALQCVRAAMARAAGSPEKARLKWPNDVMIDDRKVAGVLVEVIGTAQRRWALIGVGINSNFDAAALPPGVRERSATLRQALGVDVDAPTLETDLADRLMQALMNGELTEAETAEANASLWRRGEQALWARPDGKVEDGVLLGIEPTGCARIQTAVGPVRIASADWRVPGDAA